MPVQTARVSDETKALMEKRIKLLDQAREVKNKAKTEGRERTADELSQIEKLVTEAEALSDQIEAAESQDRIDSRLDSLTERSSRGLGRRSAPDNPGTALSSGVRERVQQDPKKGFKSPRHFLLAVLEFERSGGQHIPKNAEGLRFLQTAGSDEQMESSDPYGGFLVPEAFTPNLLKVDPEADPMAGRTTMIPMSAPTVRMPARVDKNHTTSVSGGLQVSRRMETAATASSRMKMEQVVLDAHSLFGVAYATEEILMDSPISFAALLAQGFGDEFTAHMIDERLNGSGVGEYEGIMNSGSLVTVAAEAGQANTTIKYENVINMRSRCWGYSNAVWMINHDCLPQLMKMQYTGGTTTSPIWQPSAREGEPDILLGRPLIVTEYTKTLGTLGDIVLANWTQYLEGIYQPLQSAESIHVRFLNHERTYKFWTRNAGRCWWRSPLTPKNSTATLSPFVVLAGRP